MSPEPIQAPVVNQSSGDHWAQGSEDHWAAWQAREAANARATRRKLFIVAAILVFSVAVLNGLWLLR